MSLAHSPHVLITGATGFIGARLLHDLVHAGCTVRALVRHPSPALELRGVELVEGDVTVPESLTGLDDGIDIVIHCAGILGTWGTSEATLHQVNVQGSRTLLEVFRGKTLHRFIHLSAAGVTGPIKSTAADETYVCQPATAYERTKYQGEQAILTLAKQWHIPAVAVRPTFTYGPGDPHKLPLFQAIKTRRYVFIGTGNSEIHPVYIDDVLTGLRLAMERARVGEVYILGGPQPVTIRALVNTIADAMAVPRPTLAVPRWLAWSTSSMLEFLGHRLHFEPILTRSRVRMMADNFGYAIHKASTELGYQPQTDLPTGIDRTIRYYVDHGLL